MVGVSFLNYEILSGTDCGYGHRKMLNLTIFILVLLARAPPHFAKLQMNMIFVLKVIMSP